MKERKDEQKEERGAERRELNLTLLPTIQKSRRLTIKYMRENARERNFLKFLVVKLTELTKSALYRTNEDAFPFEMSFFRNLSHKNIFKKTV